jgi:hypothetical protein
MKSIPLNRTILTQTWQIRRRFRAHIFTKTYVEGLFFKTACCGVRLTIWTRMTVEAKIVFGADGVESHRRWGSFTPRPIQTGGCASDAETGIEPS